MPCSHSMAKRNFVFSSSSFQLRGITGRPGGGGTGARLYTGARTWSCRVNSCSWDSPSPALAGVPHWKELLGLLKCTKGCCVWGPQNMHAGWICMSPTKPSTAGRLPGRGAPFIRWAQSLGRTNQIKLLAVGFPNAGRVSLQPLEQADWMG